jgi:CRISPR/Cas system-associated exonuclease Cas4 (RecB family)
VNRGHPFYNLAGPLVGPETPTSWSFSAITEWRACARRWWLTRARFNTHAGRYPERVYPGTVEGRVLHDTLERFIGHLQAGILAGVIEYTALRGQFQVRRIIAECRNAIEADLKPNPRVDLPSLRSKISIDRCVNEFRRVSGAMQASFDPAAFKRRCDGAVRGQTVSGCTEVPIRSLDPPLNGRIDWLSGREIIDFKTGERDEKHHVQLRFYALLYWLNTGNAPGSLTLIYTDPYERVPVPVPSEAELQRARVDLAAEITEITGAIASGQAIARPGEEVCRWCPAKGHCDDYWSSPATRVLRLGDLAHEPDQAEGTSFSADVEVLALPSPDMRGGILGGAYSPDLGDVSVSLGSTCLAAGTAPSRARLLRGHLRKINQSWTIHSGPASELFWDATSQSSRHVDRK